MTTINKNLKFQRIYVVCLEVLVECTRRLIGAFGPKFFGNWWVG